MAQLTGEKCIACRADSPRATEAEVRDLKPQIPEWALERDGIQRLERGFRFKNFADALAFYQSHWHFSRRGGPSSRDSDRMGPCNSYSLDPQNPRPPPQRLHNGSEDRLAELNMCGEIPAFRARSHCTVGSVSKSTHRKAALGLQNSWAGTVNSCPNIGAHGPRSSPSKKARRPRNTLCGRSALGWPGYIRSSSPRRSAGGARA